MVRLPSEYQEVEWIEGEVGWARINTGIKGNNDSLIISGKLRYSSHANYMPFYGNYLGEDYKTTRLILSNNTGSIIVNINRKAGDSRGINPNFTINSDHIFVASKNNIVVDGINYLYSGTYNAIENDTNIALNASRVNVTPTNLGQNAIVRWYWFKIQNGGTDILNFIPCYRQTDQEPGMYDTVSQTFFTNSGT